MMNIFVIKDYLNEAMWLYFFFILKVDNLKFKFYFLKEEPPCSSYKPQLNIQMFCFDVGFAIFKLIFWSCLK